MKQFDIDKVVAELARRARIGNAQAYRHAKNKMRERHARLETNRGNRK